MVKEKKFVTPDPRDFKQIECANDVRVNEVRGPFDRPINMRFCCKVTDAVDFITGAEIVHRI